jgi:hypothetical protein
VAIRPDPHELLDWDRPLAEQHPQVQQLLVDNKLLPMGKRTGEPLQAYNQEQWDNASAAFKDAGISLDKTFGRGGYTPDELRLREWKGTRQIDPDELSPKLKNIWDHLQDSNEYQPNRMERSGYPGATGQSIYQHLANKVGSAKASQQLHDAGIPGVRFQDAGSRGLPAGHPDETHNYVIFHHGNLKVIDKNGQHFGLEPVEGDPWVAPKPRTQP